MPLGGLYAYGLMASWPYCLISPCLPDLQHLVWVKEPLLLELISGVQQAPGEMSGEGGSVGSPEGSVEVPGGSVDQNQGLEDRH